MVSIEFGFNEDGEPIIYECDDEYSNKNFTGMSLIEDTALSGKVIYGSSFSQEIPDSTIFPADLTGTLFLNCNLDNVRVPEGNPILGRQPRRFKAQEDGLDWLVDENNEPISLLNPLVELPMGDA